MPNNYSAAAIHFCHWKHNLSLTVLLQVFTPINIILIKPHLICINKMKMYSELLIKISRLMKKRMCKNYPKKGSAGILLTELHHRASSSLHCYHRQCYNPALIKNKYKLIPFKYQFPSGFGKVTCKCKYQAFIISINSKVKLSMKQLIKVTKESLCFRYGAASLCLLSQ